MRRQNSRSRFTLLEEPADQNAAVVGLTDLADVVQETGLGDLHLGLDLVGFDEEHRGTGCHLGAVGHQPFENGAGFHREAELGHLEFSGHG